MSPPRASERALRSPEKMLTIRKTPKKQLSTRPVSEQGLVPGTVAVDPLKVPGEPLTLATVKALEAAGFNSELVALAQDLVQA